MIKQKHNSATTNVTPLDRRRATGAQTRQRIIEVAEMLFATEGYDAVGLRDIVRVAGINSAAVHYHFGTKEALFLHILKLHAEPIAAERMERLAVLRAQGPLVLSDVIIAFLQPAFAQAAASSSANVNYAQLRARLSTKHEAAVRKLLGEIFDQSSKAFLEVFRECLPGLPETDLFYRFHFLLGTMVYAMANPGRIQDLSLGGANPFDLDEVLSHLVPFVEAGFRARAQPVSNKRPRQQTRKRS
jgi:AcrR family transcriptional regulator